MDIKFGSSCVFIFYIVFSFSFCMLQMFVICGNDLIEKKKGWNIMCSPLSISISRYLQIQRAEISFSVCHQGINDIFTLKSITVSSFSNCQKHEDITVKTLRGDEEMKTLQCLHFLSNIRHGLITYVCIIV